MPRPSSRIGSKPKQDIPADPGAPDLATAHRIAIRISTKFKGFWYIIETGDRFFVQDTCQLQKWETLIAKYQNGKVV